MTQALDAMVKAMVEAAKLLQPRTMQAPEGFVLVEGERAMREIARAGLAAIREPDHETKTAGAGVKGEASVNGYCDIARPYPELAEAVFTAMVDKMLGDRSRNLELAIGGDLDKIAEELGVHPRFERQVINDGRAPDPLSGLPLETDAELRARIKATLGPPS